MWTDLETGVIRDKLGTWLQIGIVYESEWQQTVGLDQRLGRAYIWVHRSLNYTCNDAGALKL